MAEKDTDSRKHRKAQIGLICFVWLSAFLFLLFYGYAQGRWEYSNPSPSLQHQFECQCPSGDSEKGRYPKEAEILVSGCNYHYEFLSPSGRFLYIHEDNSTGTGFKTSLLDLETGQQTPTQSITSFVTDKIAFKENGRDGLIMDLSTGQQYPIRHFEDLQPNAYIDGKLNHQILIETLRQAKGIYLIEWNFRVLVLMSVFPTNMEKNFTFDRSDLAGYRLEGPLEQFLVGNSIHYTAIPNDFAWEAVSPDGRFVARSDGISLAATGQKIVEGVPELLVRGWVSDGSGVIYTSYFGESRAIPSFSAGNNSQCKSRISPPAIKLRVPDEYMTPH